MSYQTITDKLVNFSTSTNLQVSNSLKDSQKSETSKSFSDLVSFYKSENKEISENSKISENNTNENSQKSNKIEDVKNDEKISENKDSIESKKSDDKTKINDENSKNEQKSQKSESGKNKNIKDKTLQVQGKEKSENKDKFSKNVQGKNQNKNNENIELQNLNFSEIQTQGKENKVSQKDSKKTIDDESFVKINQKENSQNFSKNLINVKNIQNEESDFDFSENSPKEKQKFTLDKEGKITVEDLRTENPSQNNVKKSDLKVSEIKLTNKNTAEISIELNQSANADILSLDNQTAAANGSNFSQMLNNQIQNNAGQFVKAGNLILKDNNQGTINLVLHPDDLGNVKMHLSLDGKTISGHITVATKEALEVFKDNAETLREAFIKNGFENANFDVSFNNSGSFNQNMEFSNQDDGKSFVAKQVYSNKTEGFSSDLESRIQNAEDISNYSVNIVA